MNRQDLGSRIGGNVADVKDWLGRTTAAAAAAAVRSRAEEAVAARRLVLTLTGWRRRCLFGVLITLSVIVLINLSLTLWLLRSMQFSLDGIGHMKITPQGIQLNGDAMVLDALMTSNITSRRGSPLVLDSSQNITLTARDSQGRVANRIFLGEDLLEVLARDFRVVNSRGDLLFAANRQEVVVGADILRVSGVGGAVFDGSIQTPLVRAESGNDLRLESATRSLQMLAPQGIVLDSKAGDITATCYEDMHLRSTGGSVKIDASSVMLPNIRTASISTKAKQSPGGQQQQSRSSVQIYQVCVCSNGRLFLSHPSGACAAEGAMCA